MATNRGVEGSSARNRSRLCRSVLIAALVAVAAQAKEVPPLRSRVNDYAALLPSEAETRIEGKLEAFERETGAQIAVLTIPSLEGENLEDYSLRVAQTWGLGRQGVDDGVLLLVAAQDRKMRIEVGYGLEDRLTDVQSSRILRNVLRPRFRNGDFAGGIEKGVDAILGTLQGLDVIPRSPPSGGDFDDAPLPARLVGLAVFVVVVGIFSLVAVLGSGCASWFLYVFLMPFYLFFPGAFFGPAAGTAFFVAWVILFPVCKLLLGSRAGKRFRHAHPALFDFATSGGSWSSGGGWSGGGFLGGGGSFGGGGASGSW